MNDQDQTSAVICFSTSVKIMNQGKKRNVEFLYNKMDFTMKPNIIKY